MLCLLDGQGTVSVTLSLTLSASLLFYTGMWIHHLLLTALHFNCILTSNNWTAWHCEEDFWIFWIKEKQECILSYLSHKSRYLSRQSAAVIELTSQELITPAVIAGNCMMEKKKHCFQIQFPESWSKMRNCCWFYKSHVGLRGRPNRTSAQNRYKLTPLSAKCPHWLNPLSPLVCADTS